MSNQFTLQRPRSSALIEPGAVTVEMDLKTWFLAPFNSRARHPTLSEIDHAHQQFWAAIRGLLVCDQQFLDDELTKFRTKAAQTSG